MSINTIANCATGFIEAYYLLVLCDTFMERNLRLPKYVYVICTICLGALIDTVNVIFSNTVMNIIVTIFIEFLFACLFTRNKKMKFMVPIINYMIIMATEMFILLLISVIRHESIANIIAEGHLRLMGIFLSKLLGYAMVKFVGFRFDKNTSDVDVNYWILFLLMFSVTTLTLFTFCKILEIFYEDYIRNLITTCMIGLDIASAAVMILYENALKQKYVINQNQLSEIKLKEQLKHYNDIMMTQGQVKKVKHDLENHLLSIKAIIHKKDMEGCVDYIDSLLDNIDVSNPYINTGNTVLDAIIGAKKTEAERNGIIFSSNIKIPAMLPIADEDVCIIFGNALDNAIEAAMKCKNEKYVKLSLVFDKNTLICQIKNSCNGVKFSTSSKNDLKNHGIGKYNMEDSLKKYQTMQRIHSEENNYTLLIIFMGLDKPKYTSDEVSSKS